MTSSHRNAHKTAHLNMFSVFSEEISLDEMSYLHYFDTNFPYYQYLMSHIVEFQSDKVLTRTLFNNFTHLLVFVFYAEWNKPSQQLKQNLNSTIPLFGQFDNVKYFAICAEKCPETFKKFAVEYTPTVLFTQTDKKIIKKFQTDDVGLIFDSLAEESQTFSTNFQQEKQIWHPKIKSILSESPVIIFIKGTAQKPKCGFTETLLNLLRAQNIEFNYYDILQDQYMRYWLRNYSGWATYPQIYSQGKLIGGLDVCKDLIAKGQFLQLFPKNSFAKKVEQKFECLIQAHAKLIFTNGFSFEDKSTQAFIEKAKDISKEVEPSIYNLSLDENLRKYVLEVTGKSLPILFESGKLREI